MERVIGGVVREVPEHSGSVLTTGGGEGAIWRNGDRVDVTGVFGEGGLELEVGQVPDLDLFVPSAGNDDGVLGSWGKFHGGNPLRVRGFVGLVLGPFKFAKGVPEFDGFITAA